MKKALIIFVLVLITVAGFTAQAESIWQIWNDAGKFNLKGIYLGQGAKSVFGVWPVAAGHSAGSVWTYDGWNTVVWSTAFWCENVTGPYGNVDEHWVVPMFVSSDATYGNPADVTIEYALYVDDSSANRYWDNNGGLNYSVVTSGYLSGDPSYLHRCP